jgi:hypothetical protein
MPPHEPDPAYPRVDDWLDEDQVEYEVEPPDESVGRSREAFHKQMAEEAAERAATDEGWYEAQPWEPTIAWRFSLRDLLGVMAIIAITLTVFRIGGLCPATVIGGVGTFFWLLIYMERNDPTTAQAGAGARRKRPAHSAWRLPPLRISYSTADLLIAMTIACVCFSLLRLLRLPLAAATLGFFVLAGIVMYWIGASPPRRAVLAWFMLTAMYLVFSAAAVISDGKW